MAVSACANGRCTLPQTWSNASGETKSDPVSGHLRRNSSDSSCSSSSDSLGEFIWTQCANAKMNRSYENENNNAHSVVTVQAKQWIKASEWLNYQAYFEQHNTSFLWSIYIGKMWRQKLSSPHIRRHLLYLSSITEWIWTTLELCATPVDLVS